MKRLRYTILLAGLMSLSLHSAYAQRITHSFRNTSMSEALAILAKSTKDYRINFMYDELEDFKITKDVVRRTAPDAIHQIIGFYPIKMTVDGENIFVECMQKTSSKMIGRIVDAHQRPIDFANVSLLNVNDSSLITGGVTNENGQFVIPCEASKAIVRVSCVGYHTAINTYNTGKIGLITLKEATINLQKVVVKGHRKTFEMTNDGLVTQVKDTPLSEAGTANDVMAQVPSVYGSDGKYSVYGKGEAIVYVNGRKLTDDGELERISSKDIASITLNNNPGAEYDATVKAVIMIKTNKKQGDGLSGGFTSMARQGHNISLSEGGNLNWRKGGLDIFGNIYYDLSQKYQHQIDNKTVMKDGDAWQMYSDTGLFPKSKAQISTKLGFNYVLNERHSIGATYDVIFLPNSTALLTTHQGVTKNGEELESIFYNTNWNRKTNPAHYVNAYYRGELGKWNIVFDNDLVFSQNKAVQNIKEQSSASGESQVNSTNKADNVMAASKLVLSYPVGKGRIEGGGEIIYTDRKETYNNAEQIIASTNDHIKENKLAGFLNYNLPLGKLDLKAGLRYEHTVSDYYEKGVWIDAQSRRYDKLFPNAGVSFPIGKAKFSLDYTMKTRRPSYQELSSNMQYDDAFTYEKGNPLLKPEIIHDITLTGGYKWVYFNFSFQHINDFIVSTIDLQPGEGKPLNILTIVNRPHMNRYTAVLSLTPRVGLWAPRLSLVLMGHDFDMVHNGETLKLNNPLLMTNWYNSFSISEDYILTADITGHTYGDNTIVTLKPSYQLNLGITKKLKQWTFQLQATDVFRTARNSVFAYGTSMLLDKWNYSDSQAVKLTVSYRFNSVNSKYKGTGAGNEEKNRF